MAKMTRREAEEVLGLSDNYDEDLLKHIYRKKLHQYHPDLVYQLGLDPQVMESTTKKLNEAYDTLVKDLKQSKTNGGSIEKDIADIRDLMERNSYITNVNFGEVFAKSDLERIGRKYIERINANLKLLIRSVKANGSSIIDGKNVCDIALTNCRKNCIQYINELYTSCLEVSYDYKFLYIDSFKTFVSDVAGDIEKNKITSLSEACKLASDRINQLIKEENTAEAAFNNKINDMVSITLDSLKDNEFFDKIDLSYEINNVKERCNSVYIKTHDLKEVEEEIYKFKARIVYILDNYKIIQNKRNEATEKIQVLRDKYSDNDKVLELINEVVSKVYLPLEEAKPEDSKNVVSRIDLIFAELDKEISKISSSGLKNDLRLSLLDRFYTSGQNQDLHMASLYAKLFADIMVLIDTYDYEAIKPIEKITFKNYKEDLRIYNSVNDSQREDLFVDFTNNKNNILKDSSEDLFNRMMEIRNNTYNDKQENKYRI